MHDCDRSGEVRADCGADELTEFTRLMGPTNAVTGASTDSYVGFSTSSPVKFVGGRVRIQSVRTVYDNGNVRSIAIVTAISLRMI